MAIKKLQNNYTTPEQSKRLLKLGLPADSADCYHNRIAEKPYILSMPYSYSNWDDKDNPPLPCWSVGRLIEIWNICGNACECVIAKREETQIELLIKLYEENRVYVDFSKLN